MGAGASCINIERHVILIGVDGAGKSTLAKKLWPSPEVEVKAIPNKGFIQVEKIQYRDLVVSVFDVGHHRNLRHGRMMRNAWRPYFSKAKGIIFVVDASSSTKMEESATELHHLLVSNPELKDVPLLILANKSDVCGSMSAAKVTHCLNLDLYDRNPWNVQTCSAKQGMGFYSGLSWLSNTISNAKRTTEKDPNKNRSIEDDIHAVELKSFSFDESPEDQRQPPPQLVPFVA
mmetsp:Transcript_29332/g.61373  ORF Transcript_29332/g.61373 Transcript_29332/m.61373 type:complete len:232 (-) Transcript_29332:1556-2251(-)